jgi:hypothetical protein
MKAKPARISPLKQLMRNHLAGKSRRELKRLLGSQARPDVNRRGRRKLLSAFKHWQKWELALLGKCPDQELARRTGRTVKAIEQHRKRFHIKMFNSPVQRWQKWERDLLGKISDQNFARRTGRKVTAVRNTRSIFGVKRHGGRLIQPWEKRELRLLGKYPDVTVARRTGRTLMGVRAARHMRGIAQCGERIQR